MTDKLHRTLFAVMTVLFTFAGVFWAVAVLVDGGAVNPALALTVVGLLVGGMWIIARHEDI